MIRKAEITDYLLLSKLAKELWSDNSLEELQNEIKNHLFSDKTIYYIYYVENIAVAFIQCSLRYEYVEGTTTSPIAYIEGIYVKEKYRLKKIAKSLISECEKWAKNNKCEEIASDCEIENEISFKFHQKSGFKEVNRIICFVKKI